MKRKIALITGASCGFGAAIAETLAFEYDLIVTGRNEERLSLVCRSIKQKTNTQILPLVFDIRDAESCQKALETIPDTFKKIDVLINNAGLALSLDPLQVGSLEDWEQMIDTNIKGLLYITRLVAPDMVVRRSGHIINIGSTASFEVYKGGGVYCATKHAVKALTKAMRTDFLPYGIKVTQVSPGAAETNFSITRFHGDCDRAKQVYDGYDPLVAKDIADIVQFVLSRPPHVCINEITVTPTAQFNGVIVRNNN